MPFTANRQFKAAPRLLTAAEGMYYASAAGRKILDGTSGLWCVNAGHGRRRIAEAVSRQLMAMDYAPSWHPMAFDFAEKLAAVAPGGPQAGLDRIFFTGSGSESVDTALKIAIAYQNAIGQGTRKRLIGRERGYHGVGFGGISVGGLLNNRRVFPLLPGADHLRHTHDPVRNAFCHGLPPHGAETIAAVIVEPVAGSTGVLPPPLIVEPAQIEAIVTLLDDAQTPRGLGGENQPGTIRLIFTTSLAASTT